MSQPTRVSVTVGSTSRNGGAFEFKKISLSLERDLGSHESPPDAFRDVKALLERMLTEFQESKPGPAGTPVSANRGVTTETSPAGNGNGAHHPIGQYHPNLRLFKSV